MVFESESVGSNASNPVSGVHSSNSPNLSTTIFPPWQNKRRSFVGMGDICFLCKTRGHWARDCPKRSPKKLASSSSSQISNNIPIVQCHCGSICVVLTSSTKKNPNRQFYTCSGNSVSAIFFFFFLFLFIFYFLFFIQISIFRPFPILVNILKIDFLQGGSKCDYFTWCDEVRSDEVSDAPECDCGAGICLICTETSGPNSGRKYYVCPIKKVILFLTLYHFQLFLLHACKMLMVKKETGTHFLQTLFSFLKRLNWMCLVHELCEGKERKTPMICLVMDLVLEDAPKLASFPQKCRSLVSSHNVL